MHRRARGFNLIEMLVIVAIVLAMAGVVVPVVSMKKIDDQWRGVDDDLAAIADGIRDYIQATRTFPTGHSGATHYHYLATAGATPKNNVFASGPSTDLAKFLGGGDMARTGWSGPYLAPGIGPDPWGNAYVVNVNGFFDATENVLVICAGPNGQIDTPPSATKPQGDDILVVVE